ncbi:hypothetical protein FA15DRAFT_658455 [Coprinopsis marcescibilis]|uniref:Uncharacterized protein n=1 Tax=Coprinopsis marcescibilis TaxID=230819 RepID=A0A5C3KLY9_COPMA|nr:hypothetical protein FA15DRAFT_658455 [Coprinopsis marcescibilis]
MIPNTSPFQPASPVQSKSSLWERKLERRVQGTGTLSQTIAVNPASALLSNCSLESPAAVERSRRTNSGTFLSPHTHILLWIQQPHPPPTFGVTLCLSSALVVIGLSGPCVGIGTGRMSVNNDHVRQPTNSAMEERLTDLDSCHVPVGQRSRYCATSPRFARISTMTGFDSDSTFDRPKHILRHVWMGIEKERERTGS